MAVREPSPAAFQRKILAWYGPRKRLYPWRRPTPDPFAVLVSEVMLQQTQATRVEPAFEAFMERFPTVEVLARASRAEAVRAWAGLGYNRRAVWLHEAARRVVATHGGRIPSEPGELRELPGVGAYTAAAVASIAYGAAVAALDTNVRRVLARALRGVQPDEVPARDLAAIAQAVVARRRPGDWNQAVMDLGREVCRPAPRCDACPLAQSCRFRGAGRHSRWTPRKRAPFHGSSRQVRGAVVAALRDRAQATKGDLASITAHDVDRVRVAIDGLVREGLVEGDRSGHVRLAEGRADPQTM